MLANRKNRSKTENCSACVLISRATSAVMNDGILQYGVKVEIRNSVQWP